MGGKASKPGSRGKNPTYCYDWNVLMRNDRNVMVNFKPRRILDKDVVSVGDSGGYKEKPQLSQQELDL